jgi:tetratricopeptide (TPR) repeat protein
MARNLRLWFGLALLPALLTVACHSRETRSADLIRQGDARMSTFEVGAAIALYSKAVQLAPLNADAHYRLGAANLAVGSGRVAAEELHTAIELSPNHWGARLKLAELMATSSNPKILDGVAKEIQQALVLFPDDMVAWGALGVVEWKLGHGSLAEQYLAHSMALAPHAAAPAKTLAKIKIAANDRDGAGALLRVAAAGGAVPIETMLALSEFYTVTGQDDLAAQELESVLKRDPQHAGAWFELGALQVKDNRLADAGRTYAAISAFPDARYKPAYGLFLLRCGDLAGASAEFERWLRANRRNYAVRDLLVNTYLISGRSQEALRILDAADAESGPDFGSLFQRSIVNLASGRLAEAQWDVTRAVRLRPESPEVHYLQAMVYRRRGAVFSHKDELGQTLRIDPSFLAARIDLAAFLLASKADKPALDLIEAAPGGQSRTSPAAALRNWALLSLGHSERFLKETPDLAAPQDVRIQKAVVALDAGARAAAREAIEASLKSNPQDLRALILLARMSAVEGGPANAIAVIRGYAEAHPESSPVWHLLGELLLLTHDPHGAGKALAIADRIRPKQPEVQISLGKAGLLGGDVAMADALFSRLVAERPEDGGARFLLAAVQQSRGSYEAAESSYRKILEINSDYVPALYNLAYLLAEHRGKAEDALHFAEKARELAPESPAVDDVFGWVLHRRGVDSMAVTHLKDAVSRGSARACYHLAMVLSKTGSRSAAAAALEEGLKRDSTLPEASVAKQMMGLAPQQSGKTDPPDPVALSWEDLGVLDNLSARTDLYRRARGCESLLGSLDLLFDNDPHRFTREAILLLMLCGDPDERFDYVSSLRNALVSLPLGPTPEALKKQWTSPEASLRDFLQVSRISQANLAGWDDIFVAWDVDRAGFNPSLDDWGTGIYRYSLRAPSDSTADPAGWDVYSNVLPKTFQ